MAETLANRLGGERIRAVSAGNHPDGRVHPGAPAEVYTDSRPDTPYLGTIGFISPEAEFTPKNVETEELRTHLVYRLRVVVTNANDGLRQGMPVTVKLPLASSDREVATP